jgi:hypothetical protein
MRVLRFGGRARRRGAVGRSKLLFMASPSGRERLLYRSRWSNYTYTQPGPAAESDEMQIYGIETHITRLNRVEGARCVG